MHQDPNNFAIAIEIKEAVNRLEISLRNTFWTKIKDLLEKKLRESGYSQKWHVAKTNDWIGIFWKTALVEVGKYQFAVLFQHWNKDNVEYGVARGGELKKEHQRDERDNQLTLSLANDKFTENNAFTAFKRRNGEIGLRVLNRDLNDGTHQHVIKLTNDLWSLFEKTRERLERLNEAYPYCHSGDGQLKTLNSSTDGTAGSV